jgi:signal transduction histidine kinase
VPTDFRGPDHAAGSALAGPHASVVHVELDAHDVMVQVAIREDGSSGEPIPPWVGTGRLGDRIDALGGTLEVTSPRRRDSAAY